MTQWYLRNDEGHIFGPVSLPTLQLWAADGRITPEDHVSADRKTWQPAPEIGELGMHWRVEAADGTRYGPIHLLALRDMLKEGYVDIDGIIENHNTGERQEIGRALLPVLMKQNANLVHQTTQLQALVRDLESHPPKPDDAKQLETVHRLQERIRELEAQPKEQEDTARTGRINVLQARVRELEEISKEQHHQLLRHNPGYQSQRDPLMKEWKQATQSRETFEKEARKWKQLFEEERHSHQGAEEHLTAQLRDLRDRLMETETARERAALKLKQLERKLEEAETVEPGASGNDPSISSSLLESYNSLSASYDALLKQLNEKSEELRSYMDTREQTEHMASARMKEMEDLLHREREEADKARRRLAELEEAHLQLVRSYREMNDRFIRMRQSITENAPPKAPPSDKRKSAQDRPGNEGESKEGPGNIDADTEEKQDWKPKVRLT